MKKYLSIMIAVFLSFNANAAEITAQELKLTPEQNQKLTELKKNLEAEIEPVWEEIETAQTHITEIQKRYFEEFWNMLTPEQKEIFTKSKQ